MDAEDDNEDHCTDKHEEHLKCCHGKSAFATSQNDIVSYFFEIGETLFLTNNGWSGIVKVKYFSLYEANILEIVVTNTSGDNIFTTKENIISPSNPDIVWIVNSPNHYNTGTSIGLRKGLNTNLQKQGNNQLANDAWKSR